MVHGSAWAEYPDDYFTGEERRILESEPMLDVEVISSGTTPELSDITQGPTPELQDGTPGAAPRASRGKTKRKD